MYLSVQVSPGNAPTAGQAHAPLPLSLQVTDCERVCGSDEIKEMMTSENGMVTDRLEWRNDEIKLKSFFEKLL